MKTFLKRLLGLGALSAAGYAVWRAYERRKIDTGVTWDPQPFPYPPQPHNAVPTPSNEPPKPDTSWVEADGGTCPASHPVKAKLASGIFHVPGGANYDRTNADRCYISPEAAEIDGLRPAKR
ncbi:MAG: hypothetical protein WD271_00460 [Acidimicrobiia bacterium]